MEDDNWEKLDDDKKPSVKKSNNDKKIGFIMIIIIIIIIILVIMFSGESSTIVNSNKYQLSTTIVSATPSDIASGSLSITSAPSSADVYINDEYKGKTPLGINSLSPGTYTVKLYKHDDINHYVDETMTVTINSGITTKKEVMLTLGGEIYVRTDPAGALLYLDAEYKGVSPMTIEGIKPGKHKLEAILEGYNKESYEFESGMGTSNSISLFFIGKTYG